MRIDPALAEVQSNARQLVWEIRDLYRELPDTIAAIAGLHAISYNRERHGTDTTIIGGDAHIMHAPGNTTCLMPTIMTSVDRALLGLERNDPPSVIALLTSWEDAWRAERHDPAADHTNLDHTVAYLTTHTASAAQFSPGFNDYLTDLNTLRARLRAVTGHINPPKLSDAPCIADDVEGEPCNGQIVQRYRQGTRPEDRGLDDIRECNRCGETYTPLRYALAVRQRLEAVREDPERLLTATEARVLWRLSEKQLYVWENRDRKITHLAVDNRGRRLYRNGDIAALRHAHVA